MSEQDFEAEKKYQTALSLAKSMLKSGIISENEFTQIDTMLINKYRPILSMLLLGKDLIN